MIDTWNNVRNYLGLAHIPQITEDLQSETLAVELKNITLNIEAKTTDGGELSYQWYKDGEEISGAVSSSYTFTASAEDDGAEFYVKVTNTKDGFEASTVSKRTSLNVVQSIPLDVLILMDTSKSMQYDCENKNHSYLSTSVKEDHNLESYGNYLHYIVSKDENGRIVIRFLSD
ncbi:MAG: hypothetical protein ACLVKR_01605 [Lachnospiraceae bacterium]